MSERTETRVALFGPESQGQTSHAVCSSKLASSHPGLGGALSADSKGSGIVIRAVLAEAGGQRGVVAAAISPIRGQGLRFSSLASDSAGQPSPSSHLLPDDLLLCLFALCFEAREPQCLGGLLSAKTEEAKVASPPGSGSSQCGYGGLQSDAV